MWVRPLHFVLPNSGKDVGMKFGFASLSWMALVGSVVAASGCAAPASEDATEREEALTQSSNPNALFELPFYFSVDTGAMTQMTQAERQHPYATFWNPATNAGDRTGLRVIAVPNSDAERLRMSEKLTTAGILRPGDVLLTFRPGLANTLPYAHLQMATTHAGIVRTVGNRSNGVDQPLDTEHNSPNATPFQSPHYKGAPALHIVRPRAMRSADMQARLDAWLGRAQALIGKGGRPGFNDNYLAPATSHPRFQGSTATVALAIGKGLLSGDVRGALGIDMNPDNAGEQQLFCSEMVYHLLTLANCTEAEIRNASASEPPACLSKAPFEQLPFAGTREAGGLGEGPLLLALKEPALLSPQLPSVFCQGVTCNTGSAELSSGHRAANAMLVARQVPQALGLVYQTRATNANAPLPAAAAPLADSIPANDSSALLPHRDAPARERARDGLRRDHRLRRPAPSFAKPTNVRRAPPLPSPFGPRAERSGSMPASTKNAVAPPQLCFPRAVAAAFFTFFASEGFFGAVFFGAVFFATAFFVLDPRSRATTSFAGARTRQASNRISPSSLAAIASRRTRIIA
jgi:hypothetical protein